MNSLLALMEINMLAPDYTTLSRRMSFLKIKLPRFNQGKNTILMIDSSGLEMYERWPNGQQENVDITGTKCGESYI